MFGKISLIIEGLKLIWKIYGEFKDTYDKWKKNKTEQEIKERKEIRNKTLKEMTKDKTNEELKELHRKLVANR